MQRGKSNTLASVISMIKPKGLGLRSSLKILSIACIDSMPLISIAAQNSWGSHSFIGVVRPHAEKMTTQCEITQTEAKYYLP